MNVPDLLLPTELTRAANMLALVIIIYSLLHAPWRHLKRPDLQHVFLGFIVLLMLAWSAHAGIKPGLNMHLLGTTLLSLMFGLRLALVAFSLVLVAITGFGMAGWSAYGINYLLMAFIPALFSTSLFKWVDRKLPNHFFIYVFVCAFLCAGLAMSLCGLVTTYVMIKSGAYSYSYLMYQYLPFFILMAWSEAVLTGMAITLMAVYEPTWLATFDDLRYLKNRG
ncbi:MAG: hypothetical protein HOP04_06190 [Methylophilaceae bacterium]|nr:hypothetical protein [Methylophilaceae bacterium]